MTINTICEFQDKISYDEFFDDFLVRSRPLVIKQFNELSNLVSLWDIPYLCDKLQNENINYRVGKKSIHPDIINNEEIASLGFSDFIDLWLSLPISDRSHYMISAQESSTIVRTIQDDFRAPSLINQNPISSIGFWLSAKGSFSWLHYDSNNDQNFNFQVLGAKKVILINPVYAHLCNLYSAIDSSKYNCSKTELTADLQFLIDKKIPYHEVLLHPGDLIFIPAYWIHTFIHIGDFNINLNFWWKNKEHVGNKLNTRSKYFFSLYRAIMGKHKLNIEDAIKKLNQLPPSVLLLLKKIESNILSQ